ncbi:UvrD-helicase domain-containing protein [Catenuloplanes japonicus]|uniref:UvrD-helicase domain-containing protein n=1 Tax=Catenuloplanes japonicus TaxID=33876 RepID=UPI000AC1D7E0|nr:UvrD-helicase domain-containing protein [Catenuloplanes japonicus]
MSGFDVCGPLPSGTTVLEASAGTGKTYTIAALAARYVAEGRARLDELLLVTFGRSATAELRSRVRARLVDISRKIGQNPGGDPLAALLSAVPPDELENRRARLAAALRDFDAATIATTHQFCHRMLAELGLAADADPAATFAENLNDLVTEVADDLYLRKYGVPGAEEPPFGRRIALEIAREAVADAQARLAPSGPDVRSRFATAVRSEVDGRRRQARLYCYDDMIDGLHAALDDPDVRQRLRDRYAVVLVDEFQDTDPVQWSIVEKAFHGHTTLVLIGDPKQAIYGFRGADVVSYLAAADAAPAHATLGRNWRSDPGVLAACETVFGGAALGDARITVRPVAAAQAGARLPGPPFRLRVLGRDGFTLNRSGLIPIDDARAAVAADLAADLAATITASGDIAGSGTSNSSPGEAAEPPGEAVPVTTPGDIAVLVRTHKQGTQIRETLAAAGIPAVLAGTTSVFGTPAAADWLALLEGLEQPHRTTRVAAAALTAIIGWPADRLAAAGEQDLEDLGGTLRRWATLLTDHGVAALLEAITATGLARRLLARRTGERHLTDLRHIGLALHTAAVEGRLGLAAIVEWLRHRIEDAPADVSLERSRRLESDLAAVQILTVHAAKGLEYPVLYLPFGWDRHVPSQPELLRFHTDDGTRVLDVAGTRETEALRRHRAEEGGEDLRLLYVALTRAKSRIVAWWAPTANTKESALHRLLIGRPAPGEVPPAACPVPSDADALSAFRSLASPVFSVTPVSVAAARFTPAPVATPVLRAARFRRRLDTGWRRTSYSRLTSGAHGPSGAHGGPGADGVSGAHEVSGAGDGPGVTSEPAGDLLNDEEITGFRAEDTVPEGPPSPMSGLPTGAVFGTLVHAVLEDLDTTAPDLGAALAARARLVPGPAGLDPDVLAAALLPSLRTPLGPLADGRSLADFTPADRLPELDFELPLAGGDATHAEVTLGDAAEVLAAWETEPLRGYAARLRVPELADQPLRGYLTGSIDAVLRVDGPRYLVVDYKTNWLGDLGPAGPEPLTAGHYRPSALAAAMAAAHYPLQALLYAVALHRYLRWRQRGYDPERHLGGVLYLFLRGMCGPATPSVDGVPHGVFSWKPPAGLVLALSTLLDGSGPRDGTLPPGETVSPGDGAPTGGDGGEP